MTSNSECCSTQFDDVMCGRCGDIVLHEKIGNKWKCCYCEGSYE